MGGYFQKIKCLKMDTVAVISALDRTTLLKKNKNKKIKCEPSVHTAYVRWILQPAAISGALTPKFQAGSRSLEAACSSWVLEKKEKKEV